MKRLFQDERGFTLVEMLIVLTIVLVISSCVIFYSHEKLQKKIDYQLMNYIELLIRMTQLKAIEEQYPYLLYATNPSKIVIKKTNDSKEMLIYQLPEGHSIKIFTSNTRLYFKTNGNLQSFGSYKYDFGNEQYRFNIQIGKGRILKGMVTNE